MRRKIGRALMWSAGFAAVATVVVAVLHTPLVMQLMAGGGEGAGCPFGADRDPGTPQQRDASRLAALQRLKGDVAAPARPAGEFALGRTTRADLLAWAGRRGTSCRPGRDERGLQCDAAAGSARSVIYADFDAADVMVGMLSMTYSRDAQAASADLVAARAALQGVVGAPTRRSGDETAAYLAARPLRQARTEYRRANYFASLSATNLGPSGYLVSQVYQAID